MNANFFNTSIENKGTIEDSRLTLFVGEAEIPLSPSDTLRAIDALEAVINAPGSGPQILCTDDGATLTIERTERGEVSFDFAYYVPASVKMAREILAGLKATREQLVEDIEALEDNDVVFLEDGGTPTPDEAEFIDRANEHDPNAVEDARRERIERERGTATPATGT
jgi:hypothetical protein